MAHIVIDDENIYEIEYKIGQEVYVLENNKIYKGEVTGFNIDSNGIDYFVKFYDGYGGLHNSIQSEIFKTVEEVEKYVLNLLKNKIKELKNV